MPAARKRKRGGSKAKKLRKKQLVVPKEKQVTPDKEAKKETVVTETAPAKTEAPVTKKSEEESRARSEEWRRKFIKSKLEKSLEFKHRGMKAMHENQFELARMMFERSLNEIALDGMRSIGTEWPEAIDTRVHLIICRMECENDVRNLVSGLIDVDILLEKHKMADEEQSATKKTASDKAEGATATATVTGIATASKEDLTKADDKPDSTQLQSIEVFRPFLPVTKLYLMKAELHLRLGNFVECSKLVRLAVDNDQCDAIKPSVMKYLAELAENTDTEDATAALKQLPLPACASDISGKLAGSSIKLGTPEDWAIVTTSDDGSPDAKSLKAESPVAPCKESKTDEARQRHVFAERRFMVETAEVVTETEESEAKAATDSGASASGSTAVTGGALQAASGEIKSLEKYFDGLTVKSQQSLLSLSWRELHAAIDSPMFDSMLDELQITDASKLRPVMHMLLDWNLPNSVKEARARNEERRRACDDTGSATTSDLLADEAKSKIDSVEVEVEAEAGDESKASEEEENGEVDDMSGVYGSGGASGCNPESLVFFRVVFAYLLSRDLWRDFEVPSCDMIADDTPNLEEALNDYESELQAMKLDSACLKKKEEDAKTVTEQTEAEVEAGSVDSVSSLLLDSGVYGCRDGLNFIAMSIFEGSSALQQLFDLTDLNPRMLVHCKWLYPGGLRMLDWLAYQAKPFYSQCLDLSNDVIRRNINGLLADECSGNWLNIMDLRIMNNLDDELMNDMMYARRMSDANDDTLRFEQAIENVIGAERKNALMQLELDMSIPILARYSRMMHDITGINQDDILFELTLPDDKEERMNAERGIITPRVKKETLAAYLVDDTRDIDEYQAIGLLVLINQSVFQTGASGEERYNKARLLGELQSLEKEVVQFQIDFKKCVHDRLVAFVKDEAVAVADSGGMVDLESDISKEMSILQYRGLELTRWLRSFVKSLMVRREFEDSILRVSGMDNIQDGTIWFESISLYVNGCNELLLRLFARLCMMKLTFAKLDWQVHAHSHMADDALITGAVSSTEQHFDELKALVNDYGMMDVVAQTGSSSSSCSIELIEERHIEIERMVQCYLAIREAYLSNIATPVELAAAVASKAKEDEETTVDGTLSPPPPTAATAAAAKKSILSMGYSAFKKKSPAVMLSVEDVEADLKARILKCDKVAEMLRAVKEASGLASVRVPVLAVPIPSRVVADSLQNGSASPLLSHPISRKWLTEIEVFFQRCRQVREVMFAIIFSESDSKCTLVFTMLTQPNKFWACGGCLKVFSSLRCGKCGLAYYCSKACQTGHWKDHQVDCRTWCQSGLPSLTFDL